MSWLAVGLLAGVCVLMRTAVPLGLGEHRPAWLERALEAALPALLAALVVVGTVADGQRLELDPRLAGVAAGATVVAARGPLLLVVVAAAGTTAVLRALT
ncbi:MAG TPA: AzlD domain-containing protein [Thermoleophilaceae bacterium]|jgi:branched-subunit amino acid transport protein